MSYNVFGYSTNIWLSMCCPSVIPYPRDVISLHLVEGFQCNLAQMINMWLAIAEKNLVVRDQR